MKNINILYILSTVYLPVLQHKISVFFTHTQWLSSVAWCCSESRQSNGQ